MSEFGKIRIAALKAAMQIVDEDVAREIFRVWIDEGPKSAERMIVLTTVALSDRWRKGEQAGQYDFFRSAINKLRLIAIGHEKNGEAARFCATEECCDSLFALAKVMGLDGTSWKEEEPAFWSHKLIIERQEIYHQVTTSTEHPFGVPGEDFSDGEGCWVETEPLYRRSKNTYDAAQARIRDLEAALREARKVFAVHAIEWPAPWTGLLAQIDAALSSGAKP